jgi:acyl-CoA synthetase (AMP-forming)/AMP-acid ligase II
VTISDMLRQHGRQRPQKAAVIDRDKTITYRQLDRMVDYTALVLQRAGVGFEDLVGVSLTDDAQHLVMLLALGRVGATVLPLDPRWSIEEACGVADNFGAHIVLRNRGPFAPGWLQVDDSWYGQSDTPYEDPRVGADTPMVLSLSSGTTGMPKGPRVTHAQFVARFMVYWLDLGLSGRDRFVTATPLYFGGGRGFSLAMVYAGGTCLLLPPPYQPEELVAFCREHDATSMFLVPTQLRRLLEGSYGGFAFPTLRVLISSGSALYASEQREVKAKLTPNLYQYYSSTEGGGCSLLGPEEFEGHPESVGQPCFGVEVQVVGEDHRPLPPGDIGRLRYRSAASATEYFMGDGSAAFHEGWFYPGDLGAFDADGFLYLRGRSKDMIIRGGVNIYPGDIEAVLLEIPGVREAAVVGQPSREFGEEIAAFVVSDGVDEPHLRAVCAEKLARYKQPRTFVFVDSLPKSSLGKVLKAELVKTFTPADA